MGKDDTKVRRKLGSDVYKAAIEFEENEANTRSPVKDAVLYKNICEELRKIFENIATLKESNTKEAKEQILVHRTEASLHIITLKKLNRLEKLRTRNGREKLHKEKQRVDSTHLLLQNLLYEADHLDKEVTKCLQFKSKDEEIELVPIAEFLETAPPEVTRQDVTKKNKHELHLARLEWELRQRRELAEACNEVVANKERVSAAIAAAKSRLDALSPHLKDVLKSTKPLQQCLGLKLDEKRDENRAASLLIQPLYMLYANAKAYSDVLGSDFVSVSITGDEDEAKRLDQLTIMNTQMELSDSESDQENNDDEQPGKKKRHHRAVKITKEERAEAKKKAVFKRHPLSVQLSIKIKDGTGLKLLFTYLLNLKIIVVKHAVSLNKQSEGVYSGDVLALNTLYPNDSGQISPHPATSHLLNSVGIKGEFQEFLKEWGRPYVWAQRMCGLDFLPITLNETLKLMEPSQSLSVVSVEQAITVIKKRLTAQVGLMKELQELEAGKISNCDPCIKLSSILTQWQPIGSHEYTQSVATKYLLTESAVTPNDNVMFYKCVITRQSAKLIVFVSICSEYPNKAPSFSLLLDYNGTFYNYNSDDIRDIERYINTAEGDKKKIRLTTQMTKLMICFDVLLETVYPTEFPSDKVMLRTVRGRNRAKPFKFMDKGNGVFLQY